MKKFPRYLQEQKYGNGVVFYRYNPSARYIDAGIVTRTNLGSDLSSAKKKANEFNKLIDAFLQQESEKVSVQKNPTVQGLVDEYLLSSDFNMLSDKSKLDYQYFLNVMLDTKVDSKEMSRIYLKNMTGSKARKSYEVWLNRGISMATYTRSVSRKLFSYAMEMGHMESNPYTTFRGRAPKARKVVWTPEQIKQFLDIVYTKFKYRNLGLIVQMAYEWCQRVGDMRMLKFSNIDFDKGILNLEQSKRRAVVHLPISKDLFEMLKQQKQDYGFQEYVAPMPKAIRGSYKPYTLVGLSKIARQAITDCGLPNELRIADLRRTGTTEMVEAGVPMGQIMSVTGHVNPSSVAPYMKNTYVSAESALTKRKSHVKST
jgi:integrase